MGSIMPNKNKKPKVDGYTGAAKTQVGRVNRKTGKKKNGDRTTFENSVENESIKRLTALQKRNKDLMDKSGKEKEFQSDVAFERKRRALSKKKAEENKKKKKKK